MPEGIVSQQDAIVAYCSDRPIFEVRDRVLRKHIRGSVHLLQRPPAIAVDADQYGRWRHAFDALEVLDSESQVTYRVGADSFDQHRVEFDRGYGRQYFLAIGRWARHDGRQLVLL